MQTGFHALRLIYEKQVNGIARHYVLREEMCINLYSHYRRRLLPCCLEMSGASWNGIATPSWYFLMLLGDVSSHLDNISTAPCHAAIRFRSCSCSCSCQLLESILTASWLLLTILDELFLVYTDFFALSLQEPPSLVKNNWETIKKPLRRCQEGPRSVQERARLVKE